MIITCPCGQKKFEIDASLIPDNGRTLQCGSCNHQWFFKKEIDEEFIEKPLKLQTQEDNSENEIIINEKVVSKRAEKNLPIIKNDKKFGSTNILLKILNILIVFIITLISIILVLDTFKNNLISIFPNLELILYNLFESIKDIKLFLTDLIK